ncbi:MAG: T9SS type A sorting domain-containing protein [Paludibacter sp.]|jgi:hypothetical protein|nr:T9SS type A sorting domain-containing protein [Paludibacter sp.]
MKKQLLLLTAIMVLLGNTVKADFVIDNFDAKTIGAALQMKAWYATDGNATVAADPVNAANKVAKIVTTNWDAILKITVTLPAGAKLGDYTAFSFDMYVPTNANDANPNYKNGFIYLDDVKKYEDTSYPMQVPMTTWTTKTFTITSLALTDAEKAKTTFTIAFGMSTDKGNYFIDNVKLTGGPGGGTASSGYVINDFSTSTVGQALTMKAWYPADGTATVAVDPVNANNKVAHVVTTNWDAILKLTVTLPAGKKLGDFDSFSYDIYIPTNPNDQNPNYKNGFVYLDDVKKQEDTSYPMQAPVATWTTKTFTIASLNLTDAEKAKTTFTIAFGMSTDKGNYYVDNVKLNGGGEVVNPSDGVVVVNDFNASTVGQAFTMKAWYPADGTATVAVDPANSGNKAVQIVTSNWDALLQLTVTLPSGKTLVNYESMSFDIYIPTNANDANPNYKNMNIYIDNVKKFEDTSYPLQAPIATWTTKTYPFSTMALTTAELAKSTFALAFGMSTDKGNYYIDNVKLTPKVGPLAVTSPTENIRVAYNAGGILHIAGDQAEMIHLYDSRGVLQMSASNISQLDISDLPTGLYIAKIKVGGKQFINKLLK